MLLRKKCFVNLFGKGAKWSCLDPKKQDTLALVNHYKTSIILVPVLAMLIKKEIFLDNFGKLVFIKKNLIFLDNLKEGIFDNFLFKNIAFFIFDYFTKSNEIFNGVLNINLFILQIYREICIDISH